MPALYQAMREWMEQGSTAAERIIHTAQELAKALARRGVPVVASHLGYTASHTILIPLKSLVPAGKLLADLEDANIIATACRLPDKLGPDGLRLGTQEMVRRGMLTDDVDEMAAVIAGVLKQELDLDLARRRVAALALKIAERAKLDLGKAGTSDE
jgi:glycine hydroxymethyltransferase